MITDLALLGGGGHDSDRSRTRSETPEVAENTLPVCSSVGFSAAARESVGNVLSSTDLREENGRTYTCVRKLGGGLGIPTWSDQTVGGKGGLDLKSPSLMDGRIGVNGDAIDINKAMPNSVVQQVQAALNTQCKSVNGSRVPVVELLYKTNSNDAREIPAVLVFEGLLSLGAEVTVPDAIAEESRLDAVASRVEPNEDPVTVADVVVIMTNRSDPDHELLASTARFVFDRRHCMPDLEQP